MNIPFAKRSRQFLIPQKLFIHFNNNHGIGKPTGKLAVSFGFLNPQKDAPKAKIPSWNPIHFDTGTTKRDTMLQTRHDGVAVSQQFRFLIPSFSKLDYSTYDVTFVKDLRLTVGCICSRVVSGGH